MRGNALLLLGEVHDNADQHRQRLQVLYRAFASGWRPAIAMEQFDRERQVDIERARRERPGDAGHVIKLAVTPKTASARGWDWNVYRPYVELALEYDVPLVAANVSNADAGKLMHGGFGAVFSVGEMASMGLDEQIPPELLAAQEREIDAGHCHALPSAMLSRMARAQIARDAFMATRLRQSALHGVVLLAGNGHVRVDLGVPRWLSPEDRARSFAVGYLERGRGARPAITPFDAVVWTAVAARPDPCTSFIWRGERSK